MGKQPNVLFLMVDEQRHPTVYDSPELRRWMDQYLVAQTMLRDGGVTLERHYAMSTACAPSRTSLFTGEYPSLHGVTQTDGLAKNAWDPGMYWLDPNSVPTLGDWFRAAGYRTFWKGKWHISHADIIIPGTHDSLASTYDDGTQIPENAEYYRAANRLENYGFSGWIGPEPHGRAQANSGWVRDPFFSREALELLDELDRQHDDDRPWLLVNSYVNPHDIVFYGLLWASFGYPFSDPAIPSIPASPTQGEDLSTKPRCQASYVETYPTMVLPQPPVELYRKFYYFLQQRVDQYLKDVYERLQRSRFWDNTIIVFTSDHGDLLGAHGGMHQKWYQAYQETVHVPMIFSGPLIPKAPRTIDTITSHADMLPTLLGLCGLKEADLSTEVARSHMETRPFVGRDLSPAILGEATLPAGEPVYFTTSDDISRGVNEVTSQRKYAPVLTPNNIETVIVDLDGTMWKYSRYFEPGSKQLPEFEQYNLSGDPIEAVNLAHYGNATGESRTVRQTLQKLLDEQRAAKALLPKGTAVSRDEAQG